MADWSSQKDQSDCQCCTRHTNLDSGTCMWNLKESRVCRWQSLVVSPHPRTPIIGTIEVWSYSERKAADFDKSFNTRAIIYITEESNIIIMRTCHVITSIQIESHVSMHDYWTLQCVPKPEITDILYCHVPCTSILKITQQLFNDIWILNY